MLFRSCIAFSKTYSKFFYAVERDAALAVCGYVQTREDEDIKFIVNGIEVLQKNGEYKAEVTEKKASASQTNNKGFGNVQKQASKIYLRVESLECESFLKAKNLVEIFEGDVTVIFYDNQSKQYHASGLLFDVTDYTVGQLCELLGKENVVLK